MIANKHLIFYFDIPVLTQKMLFLSRLDFYEKLIGQKVDDKPYEGGKPGSDMDSQEVPGVVKVGDIKEVNGDKEESVEYTIEDYIKMLGGDKAKRRDLSDMFARASASFLGTGGVREGLAEFMKAEAAAGPSRREKIEQAAATLDIKDKNLVLFVSYK